MELSDKYMFKHKGCYFVTDLATPEYIDSLEDFEIRDSDVFLVTFPKSGTIWTQNILSLIYHEGHRNGTEDTDLLDRVPWLECNIRNRDYVKRASPRLFASHMPYYLMPKELRNGRAKIIYVARNPKDVLVSYYHFSKVSVVLEDVEDFDIFMERFLTGKGAQLHMATVTRNIFCHIPLVEQLCPFLSKDGVTQVTQALEIMHLDYCNAFFMEMCGPKDVASAKCVSKFIMGCS
ncbi:hypothetical protein JD844_024384 [Phrynosoma platyrhinos]|uniref:Sulfotransferase n=1 Tax=Phrynosoma platyrhinos TaxID=52577 RepID=A0ABQ7SY72_PHRPL|nr:hypothetical protein JD844_024384 [Phrynosoma platyrhinos]